MDDRQRRSAVGHRRRGQPRPRAGRVLRVGRPTRSGATSVSCAGSSRSGSSPPTTSTRSSRSQPDCVVYNPKWPDVDEMVRILEAGVNIVSTAAFITGHSLGDGRDRIIDACEQGGVSDLRERHQPRVRRPARHRRRRASATGSTRSRCSSRPTRTGYDSPETELPVGFGRPIDDPALPDMARAGTAVFEDAVRLVADALGIELDDVRCEAEFAADHRGPRPRLVDDPRRVRRRRRRELAGLGRRPQGGRPEGALAQGSDASSPTGRSTRATSSRSRASRACAPSSRSSRRADFVAKTFDDFMVLGMIMTALPAIDAIPAVVRGRARDRHLPRPAARHAAEGLRPLDAEPGS